LKPGFAASKEIASKISGAVVSEIGAIARPREVVIVPDMPKTRSGKIMRRVLAAISNRQDPGDVSTLANPEIVEKIRELVKVEEAKRTDAQKKELAAYLNLTPETLSRLKQKLGNH